MPFSMVGQKDITTSSFSSLMLVENEMPLFDNVFNINVDISWVHTVLLNLKIRSKNLIIDD